MINYFLAFTKSVDIFLVVLVAVATVALVWLLYNSVNKARADFFDDDKNDDITVEKFESFIERKISSSKKANFTIFDIEIQDADALKRTYGEIHYENAVSTYIKRIKRFLGTSYKVFRFDNDNIYIYFKSSLQQSQINDTAKKIIIECQKAVIIAGALKFETNLNIGVVRYPGCGNSFNEILQNLLIALISAKRKGINSFAVYDAQLGNKQSEEYKFYLEIKNAINSKEFVLYYQPIVNLTTNHVIAGEALIRWEHKTMGTLSPAKFLPIMEKTGDINWVGFWSLEQLIKQQQQWKLQYPDKEILLSMNLSPKQLLNPMLIDELRKIVKRYRVQTSDFVMEIVQFALFDKVSIVDENIKKISQMGFKIAIDNFGTEYSTLHMLNDYKIDYIKMEKSFIDEARSKSMSKHILQMLITYAKEHSIEIIAEGVENKELVEFISEQSINLAQGYHYSRPKKPQEFIQDAILTPWTDNE